MRLATKPAASYLEAAGEVFVEVRVSKTPPCGKSAGAGMRTLPRSIIILATKRRSICRSPALFRARGRLEKYPPLLNVLPSEAPPEKRLRAFIHSFLLRIFDKGPTSWHGKLMSREMVEPTRALDFVDRGGTDPPHGRPPLENRRRKSSAVRRRRQTRAFVQFQCGQPVCFYHHCRPVMTRLYPKDQPVLDGRRGKLKNWRITSAGFRWLVEGFVGAGNLEEVGINLEPRQKFFISNRIRTEP